MLTRPLTIAESVIARQVLEQAIALCENVLMLGDASLGRRIDTYMHARPTLPRLRGIRDDFARIRARLARFDPGGFVCDQAREGLASVDPQDELHITLGDQFFGAPPTGRDSGPGTLIHAVTVWLGVRGSHGHGYGDETEELSYTQARNNPDIIQSIAENPGDLP